MERNFRSLFQKAQIEPGDSIYVEGAKLAEQLIGSEQEVKILHGDFHHENILESSERGWLAIDPQCLVGERTYDLANTFYNPNSHLSMVESLEVIDRRCNTTAKQLKIDRRRILQYAFAYGCLSAAWCLEDGLDEGNMLRVARNIRLLLGP